MRIWQICGQAGGETRSPTLKGLASHLRPTPLLSLALLAALGCRGEVQDTSCEPAYVSQLHSTPHSPKTRQPSEFQNLLKGVVSACRAKPLQNALGCSAGGWKTGKPVMPRHTVLPDNEREREGRCLSWENLCKQLSVELLPGKLYE